MPDDKVNGREQLLIENAVLHVEKRITALIDTKLNDHKRDTERCLDRLNCKENQDRINKVEKGVNRNWWNHRTLVIVLITSGVLGGGSVGYGALKLLSYLTTGG